MARSKGIPAISRRRQGCCFISWNTSQAAQIPNTALWGLNGAASLSSSSVMESKSIPVQETRPRATSSLELHPKPVPGDPFYRSLCRVGSPQGNPGTRSEAHTGCPEQSVWGELGISAARSNISTDNLWKTGVERTKSQRDLGIL